MKYTVRSALLVVAGLGLSGCVAATIGAGIAQKVVHDQQDAYEDISIRTTKAFAGNIEGTVAFIGRTASQDDGGITSTLIDNLTSQFLAAGFDVIDSFEITSATSELRENSQSAIDLAREKGVVGLFTVSAQAEEDHDPGLFGIGADTTTGVTGVVLKLTDLQTDRFIMVISANYKKPQPSSQVASSIAQAYANYVSKQGG